MGRENQKQFRARLEADGRWEEALKYREGLKDQGFSPSDARKMTDERFPPLDLGQPVQPVETVQTVESTAPKTFVPPPPIPPPVMPAGYQSGLNLDDFSSRENWENNPKKQIEWVFQHWMVDDVSPADAPSPGAWALRENMRTSPQFRSTFYMNVYTKLLPNKSQLDDLISRMADDGRDELDLIETFVQQFRDKGNERSSSPSPVRSQETPDAQCD